MSKYYGIQLEGSGWEYETEKWPLYPSLLSLAYGEDEHDYTDEEDWSDYSASDHTSVYTSYQNFPETLRELAAVGKGIDEECNVVPIEESNPEVVKAALRAWLEEANFGYIYFNREYLVEQGLSEKEISAAEETAEKRREEEEEEEELYG